MNPKRGIIKYLIIIFLICLCGCEDKSTNTIEIAGSYIKEIRLSDGTKCAVVDGSYGRGISCNWK